jgi:hypothetical protein
MPVQQFTDSPVPEFDGALWAEFLATEASDAVVHVPAGHGFATFLDHADHFWL